MNGVTFTGGNSVSFILPPFSVGGGGQLLKEEFAFPSKEALFQSGSTK